MGLPTALWLWGCHTRTKSEYLALAFRVFVQILRKFTTVQSFNVLMETTPDTGHMLGEIKLNGEIYG